MPCLIAIAAVAFPRIVILVLYFFTDWLSGVWTSVLVPLLGFLFLPLTLLAYAYLTKSGQPVDAFYIVIMVLAVAIDLGMFRGASKSRKKS
jgi:hypothetical protein